MFDLSYQEKSSLGSLLTILILGPVYFVRAFQMLADPSASRFEIVLFNIGWLILLTVVEVVYHILISIGSKPQDRDERDRFVAVKASRNAYWVLVAGALGVVGHVFFYTLWDPVGRSLQLTGLMTAYILILLITLAEAVQLGSQLFYYRRGV